MAVPREIPSAGEFRRKYGIALNALLVLFLGRLSEKKSPEMLLEAIAQLPSEIDGRAVWLTFAGPDEAGMRARLEHLAAARGMQARVVFTGTIIGDEKWAAYATADVFVLPSQNENFGNTAAEAAACGTPVVVTENCGVAPLLGGVAGIVVSHETRAIASAVQEILSDGEQRLKFSAGGKQAAAKLGWDQPVRAMEQLYTELAALRPADRQSRDKD